MSNRMLVSIKNLSVSFLDNPLFSNLSISLERGKVLAVIGANGSGKTTILNLLVEQLIGTTNLIDTPELRTSGDIVTEPGISMIYLRQLLRAEEMISSGSVQFDIPGVEAKLRSEFDLDIKTDTSDKLSDGELQKRSIIKALLADCDLYLLDEPTNYLDIAGITALETHLDQMKRKNKGAIVVTHDRTLTDNLADETIFITRHGIFHTTGGASAVRSLQEQDYESRSRQAKDIGKKIRKLQEDARNKAGWSATSEKRKLGAGNAKPYFAKLSAKMAKRSKIMQRRAEDEIEKLKETKPYIPKRIKLSLPKYDVRNRLAFSLKNVRFSYGESSGNRKERRESLLLKNIELAARTRDKICLMGMNGSGKSTVIKIVRGHLSPVSGECYVNSGVKTMHVPQGLSGFFEKETLLDNFSDCGCDQTTVRNHLGAVLLRKDKVCDPVTDFSHGELMRAALVKCILMQAEFLFLDEPTSHLDIESIEVLEDLLAEFTGGFLLISHDRTFVSNVADDLYVLEGGRVRLV